MKRKAIFAAILLAAAFITPAKAEDSIECDHIVMHEPPFQQCMSEVLVKSERRLAAMVKAVGRAIAANEALSPRERQQWVERFSTSQGSWQGFRDQECNQVAPFEGRGLSSRTAEFGGADKPAPAAAEHGRVVCLNNLNAQRANDLAHRYGLDMLIGVPR